MAREISSNQHKLTPHAYGMVSILIIEYLFGMAINMFVSFPEGAHEKQLWGFAWKQVPIAIHIILGFLLLFGTIALLIRALMYKKKPWILAGSVALVALIGAIVGGSLFIPTQTDTYSFIMAIGFIIALLAYFWGIYKER